jgi:hypothetical protein
VKRGKNGNLEETRRDLLFKEFGQGKLLLNSNQLISSLEYAQVVRMLGGGRAQLQCYDGVSRQGLIRGTMRRRVWINTVRPFYPPLAPLTRIVNRVISFSLVFVNFRRVKLILFISIQQRKRAISNHTASYPQALRSIKPQ